MKREYMLYVMTSPLMRESTYKIGFTDNPSIDALLRRYRTYLCSPILSLHYLTDNPHALEKAVHAELHQYRQQSDNLSYSEWFICDIGIIRNAIMKHISGEPSTYTPTDLPSLLKDQIKRQPGSRISRDDLLRLTFGDKDSYSKSERQKLVKAMKKAFNVGYNHSNALYYYNDLAINIDPAFPPCTQPMPFSPALSEACSDIPAVAQLREHLSS